MSGKSKSTKRILKNDRQYKRDYSQAVCEVKDRHLTEWRLLTLLFRAKVGPNVNVWTLVKSEFVAAHRDEVHKELRVYRSNYE